MTIEAKVIADSYSYNTPRLTTFQLKYPRFIHAEFMTHRVFSRNASSSRAIPVQTQIDLIREDTAMPSHWGKNQSGMQAEEETDARIILPEYGSVEYGDTFLYEKYETSNSPQSAWEEARDRAIEVAQAFHDAGYHKQIVNRILEPFSHISVVCTATDYDNFFWLRRHKDAQPEIKILADAMHEARSNSTPRLLDFGDWHVPYVSDLERDMFPIEQLIMASVARCARVSYLTHDGKQPSMEKDMALYDRLVGSEPLHASPAEHQATPDDLIWNEAGLKAYENPHLHGNLTGYQQYRKTLVGEHFDTWEGLNSFD